MVHKGGVEVCAGVRLMNQHVQIKARVPEWHRHDVLLGQKVRRKYRELEGTLWTVRTLGLAIDMAVGWDLIVKQRAGMLPI